MTEPTASDLARALAAHRRPVEKVCAACGQPFTGLAHARYCSGACRQHADYQRHAEERRASKRAARARDRAQ